MNIYNDYTPDGVKLSSRHVMSIQNEYGNTRKTTTDLYIDGLILRDGKPLMWQFDGGYVDLDDNGSPTGWNYYVTDHLGSTRKVVGSKEFESTGAHQYGLGTTDMGYKMVNKQSVSNNRVIIYNPVKISRPN